MIEDIVKVKNEEVGLSEPVLHRAREPPRILYSPIPYNLLEERLRCYGRDEGVILFDDMSKAGGFAIKMAEVSEDIASVLVVDTKRIKNNLKFNRKYNWWTTPYLEINSFYCVQLQEAIDDKETSPNFKTRLRNFVEEIYYWTEIIPTLSDSQLEYYNRWHHKVDGLIPRSLNHL